MNKIKNVIIFLKKKTMLCSCIADQELWCLCLLLEVVLVCLGCHNRIPQTGWLKPWKFIFSQIWRHKVQGVVRVGFWWGSLLGFQKAPFVCPHAALPLSARTEKEKTSKGTISAKFASAACGLNTCLIKLTGELKLCMKVFGKVPGTE